MSKNLTIKIDWEVPRKIIFNALLDQMETCKYTRGPSVVERKEGGKYEVYDGKIQGVFTKIDEENFVIKMDWKFREWDSYSSVTFEFKDKDDECQMTMTQTNIPSNADMENLESGWQNQIFKAMSTICGYGIDE
ncbi:hypothetical protein PPERSA_12527 [Pseudocohnilembus persalinus]|uniref:Activator of Hsp90 ATPase homologue 1/2-like C-terminal domain-containing protein n=1 Tax=Pseudocohnilembus persalinus TaxID=266149 RepID=A0A0V0QBB3_PSEPJ|nr:hypothetical protein PPERSA_12527 [Pseudocohnilembus persalinus]|eukprot:KRW99423.1 hypothetical protein PPERSA_12527 [Pseudocohnilembus persalinus]